jgi:hypothetical protein
MVVDLLSLQICSVTGLKAHSYIRLYRVQCSMSCARKVSTIYLLAHSRKSRVGMRGNGNYASAVGSVRTQLLELYTIYLLERGRLGNSSAKDTGRGLVRKRAKPGSWSRATSGTRETGGGDSLVVSGSTGAGLRDGDGFPDAAARGGDDGFADADTGGCDTL